MTHRKTKCRNAFCVKMCFNADAHVHKLHSFVGLFCFGANLFVLLAKQCNFYISNTTKWLRYLVHPKLKQVEHKTVVFPFNDNFRKFILE